MALLPTVPTLADVVADLTSLRGEVDEVKADVTAIEEVVDDPTAELASLRVEVAEMKATLARPVTAAAWVVAGEGRAGRVRRLAGQAE